MAGSDELGTVRSLRIGLCLSCGNGDAVSFVHRSLESLESECGRLDTTWSELDSVLVRRHCERCVSGQVYRLSRHEVVARYKAFQCLSKVLVTAAAMFDSDSDALDLGEDCVEAERRAEDTTNRIKEAVSEDLSLRMQEYLGPMPRDAWFERRVSKFWSGFLTKVFTVEFCAGAWMKSASVSDTFGRKGKRKR